MIQTLSSESDPEAFALQLLGAPGGGPFGHKVDLNKMPIQTQFAGAAWVGLVPSPSEALEVSNQVMVRKTIPQLPNAPRQWNCQSWCLDVIDLFKAKGWVEEGWNEMEVRKQLIDVADGLGFPGMPIGEAVRPIP